MFMQYLPEHHLESFCSNVIPVYTHILAFTCMDQSFYILIYLFNYFSFMNIWSSKNKSKYLVSAGAKLGSRETVSVVISTFRTLPKKSVIKTLSGFLLNRSVRCPGVDTHKLLGHTWNYKEDTSFQIFMKTFAAFLFPTAVFCPYSDHPIPLYNLWHGFSIPQ